MVRPVQAGPYNLALAHIVALQMFRFITTIKTPTFLKEKKTSSIIRLNGVQIDANQRNERIRIHSQAKRCTRPFLNSRAC
jgi:hypothetical protein